MLAHLGMGANLGDPYAQMSQAIERLARPYTNVLRRASWYRSPPLGPSDQPDYVNTVVEIETRLSPIALLAEVKAIERRFGRTIGERWGPRPLDIDILTYGRLALESPALTLPHPGITTRAFVLKPLAELASDLVIPGTERTVQEWLDALGDERTHVTVDPRVP